MEEAASEQFRRPVRLICSVQNYEWGLIGNESTAGRIFSRGSDKVIETGKPYAELWIGTHESGPSFIDLVRHEEGRSTLKSWVEDNPIVLGEKVVNMWGKDLPFLFKIISVGKALSIQAHPDKKLARFLHNHQPELYKDANHKPEMAIALSEFKALCGFVTPKELKDVLTNVPEILELTGKDKANDYMKVGELEGHDSDKTALQSMFTALMTASKESTSEALMKISCRLEMDRKVRKLTEKEELVLLLEKQHPADIGVIAAFFLNYVKLGAGEGLCIGANEPHAYVSGECLECMATSDNVVRAGLTKKHRDVQTLCSMLTYNQGFPEILHGDSLGPYITRYTPPFDEFEVDCYSLPPGMSAELIDVSGPSMLLIMYGVGRLHTGKNSPGEDICEGDVFFVPSRSQTSFSASEVASLHLYRAGVNSLFFNQFIVQQL